MNYRKLFVVLVFVLAIFIRFYNFSDRITFGPEQAISLITSGKMIKEKFSLLGEENVQRVNSLGHRIYSGALFTYSLMPIQLLFSYNPILITAYFSLLNIFIGVLLYKFALEISNPGTAIFSVSIFLFSGMMIYHSLFIWNQNYIILLGLLTFYTLYKLTKRKKPIYALFLGLLSGTALSIEYYYLFTLLFLVGITLPNMPAIIFDMRHNFYLSKTLIVYLSDGIHGSRTSSISYYHFLQFAPITALFLGYVLHKIYLSRKGSAYILLIIFIYLNIRSPWIDFKAPMGMPGDLSVKGIYKAADMIAKDNPDNFNVVVLADFDTRGHVLRYPLEFSYNLTPKGVTDYSGAKSVYVLSKKSYDFDNPGVWELSSFLPYNESILTAIGREYALYKLSKQI